MWNKKIKRILALTLTAALLAGQTAGIVYADSVPSPKEEVVYANLMADGALNDVHVVNMFDGGHILDYGEYSKVTNLTTTDEIKQDGDKITVNTKESKLHYQGDMESAELPWDFEISYLLDGQEVTASQVAGATGHLEMNLKIKENKRCAGSFYDGFALQITMAIASDLCENLVAEGATIANAGKNKQITYIVLPGKGADLKIEADVKDFEMDAIALNGTRLNLNINIDTAMFTSKFKQIESAAEQLDDGAEELKKGAKDMKDGSATINEGAQAMNSGMSELYAGIEEIEKGLNQLNDKSEDLRAGSSEVYEALKTIQDALEGVKSDADDLNQLSEASLKVQNGIDSIVGGLETMDDSIDYFYEQLEDAGLTDMEEFIGYHEYVLDFITVTDTQRALFEVFESRGGLEGKETVAAIAVYAKLQQLVEAGDAEAIELNDKYVAAGNDRQVLVDYLTEAGSVVVVERLCKADIAYIEGTDKLIGGISDTLDKRNEDGLMAGAKELQSQYAIFNEKIQELVESLKSLLQNLADLKEGINLLVENYDALDSGIGEYTDGVVQIAEGFNQLYTGATELTDGASALSSGTKTMATGAVELYEGTTEMEDGTSEFWSQVKGASSKMGGTITSLINKMTGKNVELASFVSDKNTNVESVLFVIKTPPIAKAAPAAQEPQPEKELTFWQKILNLFR